MPLLITPRPWTQQPQHPAPVRSDLAKDAFLWLGSIPNAAQYRRQWSRGSAVNPIPLSGIGGRGLKWTDGASSLTGLTFSSPMLQATAGMTFLVLAAPTAEGTARYAFSQKAANFFVPQISLGFNAGNTLSAESGSITLYTRDTNAFSNNMRAASQIDGDLHCWVIGNSTSGGFVHRDGVLQSLATDAGLTGGPYFDATTPTTVGNLYSSDFGTRFSYPLYLVAAWPRLLPNSVRAALSLNPWQLFAPQPSRFWVAASSSFPVLSAATVTSITSTGATPRVTLTI